MSDNYYVPEFYEFRPGFVFEIKYKNGWREEKMYSLMTKRIYRSIDDVVKCLDNKEWNKHIRVKYLTVSDIKYLGWEFLKRNNYCIIKKGYSNPDFYLKIEEKTNEGFIISLDNGNEHEFIFYGLIRNISELQFLMKKYKI